MIRQANTTDIDKLVLLFEAYRRFYGKEPDPEKAIAFLSERISRKESVIFVNEENNGSLNGFVQLYPLFSSTRMQRLWLLNDLFVSPEFRGKGISVALIEKCKQYCAETDACGLMLETAKDNLIGNLLYPRAGFTLDSDHNYYFWNC